MKTPLDALGRQIVEALRSRGPLSSAQLQADTGKSQPTLSRAIQALGAQLVALGQGKATRYALPQPIRGMAAQQPLWWTSTDGALQPWGTATLLEGQRLHVSAAGINVVTSGELPWFMAPLRAQGFLGREWGRRLGLAANPDAWTLEQVLAAALAIDDAPGALAIGEPGGKPVPEVPAEMSARAGAYDALAADVQASLPAGSSAGGEQAKFLTALSSGERVLVKFSPPRGTPFGERWHELLHLEALALGVLAAQGIAVAATSIVESSTRTYLESTRFDRIGPHSLGRRHAVALDAVHAAFVPGPRQHWAATCEALARQRRLSASDAARVRTCMNFGWLIGNTDMHFGNLSLWADNPAKPAFELAPLYDMLPMRWRPDAFHGLPDYAAFEAPYAVPGIEQARPLALQFWAQAAAHTALGKPLRAVARRMAQRQKT